MRSARAWCVERQKILTMPEAQAAYFEQAEPRRRLSFLCPDAQCRARAQARMVAVHEDRLYVDDDGQAVAHFAAQAQSPHDPACSLVLRERAAAMVVEMVAQKQQAGRNDVNAALRFAAKRPFEVFDVYRPAIGAIPNEETGSLLPAPDDVLDPIRVPGVGTGPGEVGSGPPPAVAVADPLAAVDLAISAQIALLAGQMRTRSLQTRRLSDVVACFAELGAVDRQKAMIRLPGMPRTSYASFIQPLARFSDGGEPVVSVGGARVSREDRRFVLRFYDRVVVDGSRRELLLYLPDEQIEASPARSLLRARLLASLGEGCHARIYFFGGVRSDPAHPLRAEIRLTGLDNLVIHPLHGGQGGAI